jgi:MtN3 and saliva related transmembrane protein
MAARQGAAQCGSIAGLYLTPRRLTAGAPDPSMIVLDSQWLGYVAATLTTGSFVPQAWHTFRSSDLAGISLGMYGAFTLGVALWLAYGVALGQWPIIIANAITLTLAGTILLRTWQARRRAAARLGGPLRTGC